MKKENRETPNPLEDYQGPSQAGYFVWQRDEDGQMRPVTRMKNKGEWCGRLTQKERK